MGKENTEEVDFKLLIKLVIQNKMKVISVTLLGMFISAVYAFMLPDIYKAEVKLVPTEESSGGGLSGMLNQIGGLANLTGINLGTRSSDKSTFALEVLKSNDFRLQFLNERHLLPELMAATGWDRNDGELIFDNETYDPVNQSWLLNDIELEYPLHKRIKALKDAINYTVDQNSGVVTITVEHYSPVVAKRWADWIVLDLNNYVRQIDIEEAESSLLFLREQLDITQIDSLKSAFYKLLEQQLQTIMLANAREEYVFRTIDPALVPELKSSPSRGLIVIAGAFLGLGMGVLITLINISRVRHS